MTFAARTSSGASQNETSSTPASPGSERNTKPAVGDFRSILARLYEPRRIVREIEERASVAAS